MRASTKSGVYHCGSCDYPVSMDYNFCHQCGESVKFIDIIKINQKQSMTQPQCTCRGRFPPDRCDCSTDCTCHTVLTSDKTQKSWEDRFRLQGEGSVRFLWTRHAAIEFISKELQRAYQDGYSAGIANERQNSTNV